MLAGLPPTVPDAVTVTVLAGMLVARVDHAGVALLPGATSVYDLVPEDEVCVMVSGTVLSLRLVTVRVTLPEMRRVDAVAVTLSVGAASVTVLVCAVAVLGGPAGLGRRHRRGDDGAAVGCGEDVNRRGGAGDCS